MGCLGNLGQCCLARAIASRWTLRQRSALRESARGELGNSARGELGDSSAEGSTLADSTMEAGECPSSVGPRAADVPRGEVGLHVRGLHVEVGRRSGVGRWGAGCRVEVGSRAGVGSPSVGYSAAVGCGRRLVARGGRRDAGADRGTGAGHESSNAGRLGVQAGSREELRALTTAGEHQPARSAARARHRGHACRGRGDPRTWHLSGAASNR